MRIQTLTDGLPGRNVEPMLLALMDTFGQWIRRRASASLALNSHSL
jgi:hypothetical protein